MANFGHVQGWLGVGTGVNMTEMRAYLKYVVGHGGGEQVHCSALRTALDTYIRACGNRSNTLHINFIRGAHGSGDRMTTAGALHTYYTYTSPSSTDAGCGLRTGLYPHAQHLGFLMVHL